MDPLDAVIRQSPVIVHRERYAVAKVPHAAAGRQHFAVFDDGFEKTVVTTEPRLVDCTVTQVEQPFAMLEFRVAAPFEGPGFLARICAVLAERFINVLVYSTFSRDYVLVRWDDLDESVRLLRNAGFVVEPQAIDESARRAVL